MKPTFRKFAVLFIIMIASTTLSIAQTTVKHIVDRGETITSIAKRYGTTEAKIIELNPNASQFIYVGMELTIPVIASNISNTDDAIPQTTNQTNGFQSQDFTTQSISIADNSITPNDFSCFYLSWNADYKYFDKGSYGFGVLSLNENGWGGTFSFHGNWGIVKPGSLSFYFGPAYGYVIHPNVMLLGQLRGFLYTYEKANNKTPTSTDQKVDGGVFFAPGIRIRADKFSIGAAFNFGWKHGYHKVAKNIELTIGYKFK